MDAETLSLLCPCGNIDCLNLTPQRAEEIGISNRVLVLINPNDFTFSELHHMGIVVLDPEHITAEKKHENIYSIKCTSCGEAFLIIRERDRCILAFRKELSVQLNKMRRGGRLLNLPGLSSDLRSFVCKALRDPRNVVTTISFEDFSRVESSDVETEEIASEDPDLELMFNPHLGSCLIGAFEETSRMRLLEQDGNVRSCS